MSKKLLSFCSITELHDRTPSSVSPLGELTNKTRTYCNDPKIYQDKDYQAIALYNFYAKEYETTDFKPTLASISHQIEICSFIYNEAKANRISDDELALLQMLKNQFTKNVKFTDIGEMVTNSSIYLPSYIEMEYTEEGSTDTIMIKIWFANEHFESEYPYQEIIVILPIPTEDIDSLYGKSYVEAEKELEGQTPSVVEDRVIAITDNFIYPYTARFNLMYLFHDTINNVTVPTYFNILIRGNPADTDELILDAIAKTILDNSNYSEEQWTPIYPDIFNPLEFVCIPHFEKIGLENKALETSTFSPIVNYADALDLPKLYVSNLAEADLIKSLQVVPFMYKSVQVSFIAKADNYGGKNQIGQIISDYQLTEVDSPDAGLMEVETLQFIKDMQTLISASETMTPTNLAVKNIRRVIRNGKFFVAKRINKINYVMVSRYQLLIDGVITDE